MPSSYIEELSEVLGWTGLQTANNTHLGDKTKTLLKSIGITKDKYQHFKETIGLPSECNCDQRQDWLNTVPAAFKSGGWQAAKAAAQAITEKYAKPR